MKMIQTVDGITWKKALSEPKVHIYQPEDQDLDAEVWSDDDGLSWWGSVGSQDIRPYFADGGEDEDREDAMRKAMSKAARILRGEDPESPLPERG